MLKYQHIWVKLTHRVSAGPDRGVWEMRPKYVAAKFVEMLSVYLYVYADKKNYITILL